MKSVVGPDELVTPEYIHQMTLLRNCVKETLRLGLFCTVFLIYNFCSIGIGEI